MTIKFKYPKYPQCTTQNEYRKKKKVFYWNTFLIRHVKDKALESIGKYIISQNNFK